MDLSRKRGMVIVLLGLTALLNSATRSGAQGMIDADAVLGGPIGVGRVIMELPREALPDVLGLEGVGIAEADGRALYPVVDQAVVRQLLRELLARPQRVAMHFLFVGEEPLRLEIQTRRTERLTVRPRRDPRTYERLLAAWWRSYGPRTRLLDRRTEYPLVVENYLQTMLAQRLRLALPEVRKEPGWQQQLEEQLGWMLLTEPIRLDMQRDRLLGRASLSGKADQPLPEPIRAPALELPEPSKDVEVEPIALRVPEECLYMRFGSITNFIWFRDVMERWKGDFRNLMSSRGLNYEIIRRNEDRISLRQGVLREVLGSSVLGMIGDTVVADVAMIGTDQYQREGASFGVLFQARNNLLFGPTIRRQRAEAITSAGAKEETVTLAGKQVSLISTADHRIRSFYATDGDFHLVTPSRTIARRFLETAQGGGRSLGASKEFRHARSLMPAGRTDTAFIYLSDAFFRNLVSPAYRIELVRRLQADSDVALVQLARLAAKAEGKPNKTIAQLIEGGLLPPQFGPRPDGSRAVLDGEQVSDSLRGGRGKFLPAADVEVTAVTSDETRDYERFREFYSAEWGRVDPMMITIRRTPLPENRERLTLDVRMTPLNRRSFERLSQSLGPPETKRLAPLADDLAAGEAVLREKRMFFGIKDAGLPVQIAGNRLLPAGRLRDIVVGYVGSTGGGGLLEMLQMFAPRMPHIEFRGLAERPDTWLRRQWGPYTVVSLHPEVLDAILPQLRFQDAERPAQIRLSVGDVTRARMTPLLNSLGYVRTRETSLGNIRLMHSLEQQLRVPGSHAKETAELLVNAKLSCPLGGEYMLEKTVEGLPQWTSTALKGGGPGRGTGVPEGFLAPPLDWFRGLKLDALVTERGVDVYADVLTQWPAKATGK